jgi:hypothetical protein
MASGEVSTGAPLWSKGSCLARNIGLGQWHHSETNALAYCIKELISNSVKVL